MTLPIEIYELEEAAPALLSLAIMELLLSIDRLHELSERAQLLPAHHRRSGLIVGGAFADLARLLGLVLAAPLISKFVAVKLLGALYLIERMTSHFVGTAGTRATTDMGHWGFSRVVFAVAFLDLSYSIGNLVGALSLTRTVWVVASSVIFWMAMTRLLTGPILHLRNIVPALRHSVPLLSGGIGGLLIIEMISQQYGVDPTTPWQQFWGLVAILAAASCYHLAPSAPRQIVDSILHRIGKPLMRLLNAPLSALFSPLRAILGLGGLSDRL